HHAQKLVGELILLEKLVEHLCLGARLSHDDLELLAEATQPQAATGHAMLDVAEPQSLRELVEEVLLAGDDVDRQGGLRAVRPTTRVAGRSMAGKTGSHLLHAFPLGLGGLIPAFGAVSSFARHPTLLSPLALIGPFLRGDLVFVSAAT